MLLFINEKLFPAFYRIFVAMRTLKTAGNFLLTLTLLVATSGITLSKHYCMGRLKAVAVFETVEKKCPGAHGEEPMPCCEDVTEEFKLEEITTIAFEFDATPSMLELATIPTFDDLRFELRKSNPWFPSTRLDTNPPPPDADYQASFQVFRI